MAWYAYSALYVTGRFELPIDDVSDESSYWCEDGPLADNSDENSDWCEDKLLDSTSSEDSQSEDHALANPVGSKCGSRPLADEGSQPGQDLHAITATGLPKPSTEAESRSSAAVSEPQLTHSGTVNKTVGMCGANITHPAFETKALPRTWMCKRSCGAKCDCSKSQRVQWNGDDAPVSVYSPAGERDDEQPRHKATWQKDVDNSASSMALGLWKRRSQLSSATVPRWERVVLTVDSGASDTIIPPAL